MNTCAYFLVLINTSTDTVTENITNLVIKQSGFNGTFYLALFMLVVAVCS